MKVFLEARLGTDRGDRRDTLTGTPQRGILSPLVFNGALTAVDKHATGAWREEGGAQRRQAQTRHRRGQYVRRQLEALGGGSGSWPTASSTRGFLVISGATPTLVIGP